eukprot:TRINITY_DN3688_c0_g2_i2.p1 TRINITY_DN3688_c0_g2~~TRINITY_DN3688_c0_g2_i2.p1  ORF type:complete len:264 (-),score=54.61 TRINITY_DN3688_c0_g2_i2:547-1338(-)
MMDSEEQQVSLPLNFGDPNTNLLLNSASSFEDLSNSQQLDVSLFALIPYPLTDLTLDQNHQQNSSLSSPSPLLDSPHLNKQLNLKDREIVAHAAYKVWLRIRPGHKEVKDHWWALYYKRIHPRYHIRDNYLGRKINTWIEEDLENLRLENPSLFQNGSDTKLGRKPKLRFSKDGKPAKKRKPNSTKDGTQPAYVNVELVHPVISHESQDPYLHTLLLASVDRNLDWERETLEQEVEWFKNQRNALMENIPGLKPPNKILISLL